MTIFGCQTGVANTSIDELRSLWRRIEDGPFDWISVWDHFYAADGATRANFEAVAVHTALAMSTTRVRCGALVYCAGYRHPAVLANAMVTIDHLSAGRCEFGIGAGWALDEYRAHGFPFGDAPTRLDIMEESLRCVIGLLRPSTDEGFTFHGRHFDMVDAVCQPRTIQDPLPIWVGGGGELRSIPLAAELADGWNVPYISPEEFERKCSVLDAAALRAGRAPSEIRRAVNVGCARDETALRAQFGEISDVVRPGVLMGSPQQIVDAIGRYEDAGADQINLAMRAPFELDALDLVADAIASR